MTKPFFSPCFARSSFPAPMFCPTKVMTAVEIPASGMSMTPSMRDSIARPAMTATPNSFVAFCSTIIDIIISAFCSPVGTPSLTMSASIFQLKLKPRSRRAMRLSERPR